MKYLIPSPDRYGRFGHQTHSILSALFLAYITDNKVVRPKYMYFAEKWNGVIDWSKSKFSTSKILESPIHIRYLQFRTKPDEYGNTKGNFENAKAIKEALDLINSSDDNSLIFLPFDQSTGILAKLFNYREIKQDFLNLFIDKSFNKPANKYACIHIRRGDCTRERHPQWFVSDSFYINLITLLHDILPTDYQIQICTQGSGEWITQQLKFSYSNRRLKINTTNQLFINETEINDFLLMKNADILFCAGSTFSHIAAYLGNHQLVFDVDKGAKLMLEDCRIASTIDEDWSKVENLINEKIKKLK